MSKSFTNRILHQFFVGATIVLLWLTAAHSVQAASSLAAGFGKQDITPAEPVRLSGYATRNDPFKGVQDRLYTRCMAIGPADATVVNATKPDRSAVHLVVSIEGLAVTSEQTKEFADHVQAKYGIERAQIVVCSTHSHAAPHPSNAIRNLFRQPLSGEEQEKLDDYTEYLNSRVIEAIDESIEGLRPAEVSIGDGRADFAVNRRVLTNGLWSGFGVTPDGPTDRRVRVMKAVGDDGKLLGAVFQYACHCTTLGPSFNKVTGDWAGLAAFELENKHDAVFVPVIGCGADANPEPRDSYSSAVKHGQAMAMAVDFVVSKTELKRINSLPTSRFGYAGLSAEQPSKASIEELLGDSNASNRNWAALMLEIWEEKGRLPESYPAPIHTWAFGDSLAWVFLGGEVVVDYQIRLEKELNGFGEVWVAAYTDDCFAYVASERMRDEGGYEVDFSMIYYAQPGRWESGTEDLLVRRVQEVLSSDQPDAKPKSPEESLSMIRVPEQYDVSLVASEPLVVDPINIAFAADGSVWGVEMADYPLGVEGGGNIKRLRDTDGDGQLDHQDVFLSGLNYPTSVMPWRDGVVVIAAPDVLFAQDTDGDGVADKREVLLTGIGEANPQHRASGFEWGLDGYVYFGAGDDTDELTSHRNGQQVSVRGGDVRWNPDTGEVAKVTGKTQFLRSRDRWGRWFGNSNSLPLFHYRFDDRLANQGNAQVEPSRLVLQPGVAPPVYPRSRTVDRFNDLFAKHRFTSACGSIVVRGQGVGDDMQDAALICEPVHNLVARFALSDDGDSVRGERLQQDLDAGFDWMASADTWFRPVRTIEAPDGSIWVVDMYRRVIEHPEWIPDAWQQQIDLRSGSDAGRIYRVARKDTTLLKPKLVSEMGVGELVETVVGPNALLRDLAMQRLVWEESTDAETQLRSLIRSAKNADGQLQAFATLVALGVDQDADWQRIFENADDRVVAWVAKHAGRHDFGGRFSALLNVLKLDGTNEQTSPQAQFQALLTIGQLELSAGELSQLSTVLTSSLATNWRQSWLLDAMSMMRPPQSAVVLLVLAEFADTLPLDSFAREDWNRFESAVNASWKSSEVETRRELVAQRLERTRSGNVAATSELLLVLAASRDPVGDEKVDSLVASRVANALRDVGDSDVPVSMRLRGSKLLGTSAVAAEEQVIHLRNMLSVEQPTSIRNAALTAAYRIDCAETADVLMEAWPNLIPSERRIAGATLLQRFTWTRSLADGLVDQRIRIADLDPATLSDLQNCRDYRVMKKIGSLIRQPTATERTALVKKYVSDLSRDEVASGERLSRGRQLYKDNCAVCHDPKTETGAIEQPAVGPALANLKDWNNGQWVTSILDPNATVEPKYRQYRVLTDSGQVLAGRVMDQSDGSIVLGMSDGRRIEVRRGELETIEDSGVSLMPEGFEAKLAVDQMSDLVAFLRSM